MSRPGFWKKSGVLLLSGAIIGGLQSVPQLWFLFPFGLYFALKILLSKAPLGQKFLFGFIFGFGLMGATLAFVFNTVPLDWGLVTLPVQIGLVIFYWISVSAVLALGTGVFAFLGSVMQTFLQGRTLFTRFDLVEWVLALILSFLWIFSEILRAWLFTLLSWGPGSVWGGHFSFGALGYLLADHDVLVPLSKLGGVYLLSFILFLFGYGAYIFIQAKLDLKTKMLTGALALAVLVGSGEKLPALSKEKFVRHEEKALSVGVLTTNFPSRTTFTRAEIDERYHTLKQSVETIFQEHPDLDVLVLPEGARFIARWNLDKERSHAPQKLLIIDSTREDGEEGLAMSVVWHYRDGKAMRGNEKHFLMPQGEYMPSLYEAIIRLFAGDMIANTLIRNRSYKPAELQNTTTEIAGVKITTRFCSELVSPYIFRTSAEETTADMIVNVASQSFFNGSQTLFAQTLQMAKIRAVETGAFIIYAGNAAPSFVVDQKGKVIAQETDMKNAPSLLRTTLSL